MNDAAAAQLSALADLGDFDSLEFVDRIAGLFRHSHAISGKADRLLEQVMRRVAGIRRNTFAGLALVGEALLRVQEARPQGFEEWFSVYTDRLGFKLTHARICQRYARCVREHQGDIDAAYLIAIQRAAETNRTRLAMMRIAIPQNIEDIRAIPEDRGRELFHKIEPVYQALVERFGEAGRATSPRAPSSTT